MQLQQLAEKYKTGKLKHSYIDVYEALFADFRDKELTLLEIGIAKGASLLMWRDYFLRASIFSLDIDEEAVSSVDINNCQCFQGDQTDKNVLDAIILRASKFDIIIDDGSHVGQHQQICLSYLFPHLKRGGLYLIEDLHTNRERQLGIPKKERSKLRTINMIKHFQRSGKIR
ncbi:hypothetical protein LCGC14_1756360, partial [marine sediment metagenome]